MSPSPVYSAEEMKQYDAWVGTEYSIAENTLVEHAGRLVFQEIVSWRELEQLRSILILCGSGGNGADGLVLARLLCSKHPDLAVTVLLSKCGNKQKPLNSILIRQVQAVGAKLVIEDEIAEDQLISSIQSSSLIVDALLGTGFNGKLSDGVLRVLNLVRKYRAIESKLVTIDIPSGIDADLDVFQENPYVAGAADLSIVIQAHKLAEMAPGSERYYGEVRLVDIGMPPNHNTCIEPKYYLTDDYVSSLLVRSGSEHLGRKGDRGHVLVIGGSIGMTGAPVLAGLGAFGGGAGKVTITFPSNKTCEEPSLMVYPLDSKNGFYALEEFPKIKKYLKSKQAVVIGPGIGVGEEISNLVILSIKEIIKLSLPCVIDADALTALSSLEEGRGLKLSSKFILTPHEGEFLKLEHAYFGNSILSSSRYQAVKRLAEATCANIILKGPKTLYYEHKSGAFYSPFQSASLSVAGSGDVLAGLIGGLISRGYKLGDACKLSIFIHGGAGAYLDLSHLDGMGVNASTILGALSSTLRSLASSHDS
jgi:hydroxyethylthiazole kinase-like uncharacterized protein yjeF